VPDNHRVLPRLLTLDLPFALPDGVATDDPLTWVIVGAALAVAGLFAVRRARRLVIVLALGTAGAAWAWSSGALPIPG